MRGAPPARPGLSARSGVSLLLRFYLRNVRATTAPVETKRARDSSSVFHYTTRDLFVVLAHSRITGAKFRARTREPRASATRPRRPRSGRGRECRPCRASRADWPASNRFSARVRPVSRANTTLEREPSFLRATSPPPPLAPHPAPAPPAPPAPLPAQPYRFRPRLSPAPDSGCGDEPGAAGRELPSRRRTHLSISDRMRQRM